MSDIDTVRQRIKELQENEVNPGDENYGPIESKSDLRHKIQELKSARKLLFDAALEKANGIKNYRKQIAITLLKLRNGVVTEWEGLSTKNLPVTLMKDVAEGICYQELFDKEIGDSGYKALITFIEAIQAELNGLQSINKHLD